MLTILTVMGLWALGGFCTLAAMWKFFDYVRDSDWPWIMIFWPYFVFLMVMITIVEFFEDEE